MTVSVVARVVPGACSGRVRDMTTTASRRPFPTYRQFCAGECWLGDTLNPHRHEEFDQLVHLAEGRANYYVDGIAHDMRAGSFLLVPRGSEHYVEPTQAPCVNIDFFVPPRADLLA